MKDTLRKILQRETRKFRIFTKLRLNLGKSSIQFFSNLSILTVKNFQSTIGIIIMPFRFQQLVLKKKFCVKNYSKNSLNRQFRVRMKKILSGMVF